MDVPYFKCEDCGHEFERTRFSPDIEEGPVQCPSCSGMDILLITDVAVADTDETV